MSTTTVTITATSQADPTQFSTSIVTLATLATGINLHNIASIQSPDGVLPISGDVNLIGTAPVYRVNGSPLAFNASQIAVSPPLNGYSNVYSALDGLVTAVDSLAGGAGGAAGTSGQVQFNAAGVLAASPNLFWDNANGYLGIGNDGTPPFPLTYLRHHLILGQTASANQRSPALDLAINQPQAQWAMGGMGMEITFSNYAIAGLDKRMCQILCTNGDAWDQGGLKFYTGNQSQWDKAAMVISADGKVDIQSNLAVQRFTNDNSPPVLYSWKTRGTQAAPQNVQNGDTIMYWGWGAQAAYGSGGQGAFLAAVTDPNGMADFALFVNDGTDPDNGQQRLRITANGIIALTGPGNVGNVHIDTSYPHTSSTGFTYLNFHHAGQYIAGIGAWDHNDPNSGMSIDVGTHIGCIYITKNNGFVKIGGGTPPQFTLDVNGDLNVFGAIRRNGVDLGI